MIAPSDGGKTPVPERIAVFVDFWNYELSTKREMADFKTDWPLMGRVIYSETATMLTPEHGAYYCGMFVYGSYSSSEASLRRWATTVLPSFTGIKSTFVPRRKQVAGPKCPTCHGEVEICPACKGSMRGEKEKGVDTLIATDMIRLAWENLYDSAVLITADEDLAPVVRFLATKGKRVLHGKFPPKGAVLSRDCWGQIRIPELMSRFARS